MMEEVAPHLSLEGQVEKEEEIPVRNSQINKVIKMRDRMFSLEKCECFCMPNAGSGEHRRLGREAMDK